MSHAKPVRHALSRRHFLTATLGVSGALAARQLRATDAPRTLALFGMHTREYLDVEYYRAGRYLPDALAQIDNALRDHRENASIAMDVRLLDLLHTIGVSLNTRAPFRFISGYRTEKTNEALRAAGRGVAKHSFHTVGRAIDILPPEVPLADLVFTARLAGVGGVGQYTRRGFVHLDTGPVRHWVR
ncbi:MAG: DUF882 domain-containing protein [Pseudomonadota bacterium]